MGEGTIPPMLMARLTNNLISKVQLLFENGAIKVSLYECNLSETQYKKDQGQSYCKNEECSLIYE